MQYGIHGAAAIVGGALAVIVGRFASGVTLPRNAVGFLLVLLLMLAACLRIGGLIGSRARAAKFATTIGSVLLGDIVALTPLGAGALARAKAASGSWLDHEDLVVIAAWTAVLGTAATRYSRWE